MHDGAPSAVAEVALGPLDDSLGFLLRIAQLQSFEEFYAALGDTVGRPGETSVLLVLGENPGIRQGVLASALRIKRAHMAKMVRALEEGGLIARHVPQDDRRAQALDLTEAGKDRVAMLRAQVARYEARPLARLSKTEEAQLKQLLRRYLGQGEVR